MIEPFHIGGTVCLFQQKLCANCEYKDIGYPRCRGVYMADRIIEEFKN